MKTKVGFIFYASPDGWIGGRNYYISLMAALERYASMALDVHVFVGSRADLTKLGIPRTFKIVRHAIFDRNSISWYIDKIFKRLFGFALLSSVLLRKYDIRVVSHVDPVGLKGVKRIIWIPDFQHLRMPEYFSANEIESRNSEYARFITNSDIVLVSSEAAKTDLLEFAPDAMQRVRVLRFASMTPSASESKDGRSVCNQYGIERDYFYVPNQFWVHKNHMALIEAIRLLKSKNPNVLLVCSGALQDYRGDNHIQEIQEKIRQLELSDNFRILGLIPYEHIAHLMINSLAVINPSYFEGWSTTVEEAKSLGCTLIISDIAVHREQCEGLANVEYFSPDKPVILADKMALMLDGYAKVTPSLMVKAINEHENRVKKFSDTYLNIIKEL